MMLGSGPLVSRAIAWCCSCVLLCFEASPARAAGAEVETKAAPTSTAPERPSRALASAGAVVPGAVVHGTGHWISGEAATARRLLLAEAAGLGLVFGSGSVIVLTGASRQLVGPMAAGVILGVGLFSTSMLADLYGSVSTDGGAARPLTIAPWIEAELGYRYVHDPQFSYTSLLVQRLASRVGRFRLEPSLWGSLDADNARYRAEIGYRPLGPIPHVTAPSSDHLELEIAFTQHRYAPEQFAISSAELAVGGRYDLGALGTTLRGAFVEGEVGAALQSYDYDLDGSSLPNDVESLLLARFAFGVVLRGQSAPGSEIVAYYDHRHDGYAAGLKLTGLGSGVAGHFGLAGRWFFDDRFGIALEAEVGSAYVAGGSILFRQGVKR